MPSFCCALTSSTPSNDAVTSADSKPVTAHGRNKRTGTEKFLLEKFQHFSHFFHVNHEGIMNIDRTNTVFEVLLQHALEVLQVL